MGIGPPVGQWFWSANLCFNWPMHTHTHTHMQAHGKVDTEYHSHWLVLVAGYDRNLEGNKVKWKVRVLYLLTIIDS